MTPSPETQPPSSPDGPGLMELFRRYLFFAWLFRDASRGSLMERRIAWRHNQAGARWLPVYMRRHLVLSGLLFSLGASVEHGLGLPVVSAFFYVPSILALHCEVVVVTAWLGLKLLPPPV